MDKKYAVVLYYQDTDNIDCQQVLETFGGAEDALDFFQEVILGVNRLDIGGVKTRMLVMYGPGGEIIQDSVLNYPSTNTCWYVSRQANA